MGEVEAAAAGEQELAADRRHPVIDRDGDALTGEHFGRHQPGGAATNNGGIALRET